VALNVEDLEETNLGFKVTIRHSKTDQERPPTMALSWTIG
jgi:hypothetical protein